MLKVRKIFEDSENDKNKKTHSVIDKMISNVLDEEDFQ